jgi:hypothetical protein
MALLANGRKSTIRRPDRLWYPAISPVGLKKNYITLGFLVVAGDDVIQAATKARFPWPNSPRRAAGGMPLCKPPP